MILKALRQPQKVTKISVLGFCILFLGFAFLFPDFFKKKLGELTVVLLQNFGFFYLILGFLSVILLFVLAFSKWGKIRFGQERPAYSWFSWIAMLYSTGMGAGLLLRAVQEPVFYFQNPPRSSILSTGDFALQYTFFHWGLTPWAFYGLFGLIMAYVLYVKKAAALSSSLLSGEAQISILAVLMNVLTIVCTLLGVVAALGLGSRQLLEAIGSLGDIPTNALQAVMAVVVVTGIATTSALLGMQKGIKNLSNFNLSLATVLLISVAILSWSGGVQFGFLNILGNYVYEFASMSLNLGNHQVGIEFLQDWTYFYWAFWLAWAPFTGVFIARISKGRSIREFVLAVLIVPALGTFIWFTVFGQSAFHLIQSGKASFEDFQSIYTGLFIFLDYFPWAGITKIIGLVLVFTFLITSVDSAIYVLSMFTDRGNVKPSKTYRLFWGLMIGLFTIGLILIGKEALLEAVSQMLIVFAFPFSLMFLGMAAYFVSILFSKKMNYE
ncbi:Glycine betaine transporter OpuD [Indibacter alkaliphilus LW1]|uniref:Glycine betaine transporter OpuD n=1 Tax=Indibacter alkaliphilus (strain CCUG 57479 / KCTC 22604 / LW1) TaxID=1189612 RepID=S2DDW9_INDAL|nr:BCCT family transporter [Indibacter alkaliphilus]EOZ95165.1 Glycine betaine transporter OpuD [Indibacter alkaliphilus LW1]